MVSARLIDRLIESPWMIPLVVVGVSVVLLGTLHGVAHLVDKIIACLYQD